MDNIIEAFTYVMQNTDKFTTKGVVSDLSNLSGTFTMLMDFFEQKLYPYMINKGISCQAFVLNSDAFIKFSHRKLTNSVKDQIQTKVFENIDDAESLVLSVIKK